MCDFIITPLLSAFGGGAAATAAGATAGAATAGTFASTLTTLGTLVSIGGSLYQGIAGAREARAQSAAIEEQKATEAKMTAIEERRTRARYTSETRRQVAQLAARGIASDSVTAILLGQSAAQEMSFASQGVRQGGAARQTELTQTQKALKARGTKSMLGGVLSASDSLLAAAPDIWPGLKA